MYVKAPKERFLISTNTPIRFLKDGCWRKAADGIDLISPESGAIFRFKSDKDFGLFANDFAPIRIGIVIKDKLTDKFVEKLVLLTAKTKIVVAEQVENEFYRNSDNNYRFSTLVLALSAEDNPELDVKEFPKGKNVRNYSLRYNQMAKKFDIPTGIGIGSVSKGSDEYGYDAAQIHPQLDGSNEAMGAQSLQVAVIQNFENRMSNVPSRNVVTNEVNCLICFGAHHSSKCSQGEASNCFECHVPARSIQDHAQVCSVKHWFVSACVNRYVKIPVERCRITFQSPIHIFLDGKICEAYAGMVLFSAMADTFFKFETAQQISLLTTGYSRIRVPITVQDKRSNQLTERLVIMTSHDRAIIVAKSTRPIIDPVTIEHEHNTPLVIHMLEKPCNVAIQVHGAGGKLANHEIMYHEERNKFKVPDELDPKSKVVSMTFDSELPLKNKY